MQTKCFEMQHHVGSVSSCRNLFSRKPKDPPPEEDNEALGWKLFGKVPPKQAPEKDPQLISQEYHAKCRVPTLPPVSVCYVCWISVCLLSFVHAILLSNIIFTKQYILWCISKAIYFLFEASKYVLKYSTSK